MNVFAPNDHNELYVANLKDIILGHTSSAPNTLNKNMRKGNSQLREGGYAQK